MRRVNRSTVDMPAGRGMLRTDRPADEPGDLLWLLVHPDNYHRLVEQAGWSIERYTDWLRRAAVELLLSDGCCPMVRSDARQTFDGADPPGSAGRGSS